VIISKIDTLNLKEFLNFTMKTLDEKTKEEEKGKEEKSEG